MSILIKTRHFRACISIYMVMPNNSKVISVPAIQSNMGPDSQHRTRYSVQLALRELQIQNTLFLFHLKISFNEQYYVSL